MRSWRDLLRGGGNVARARRVQGAWLRRLAKVAVAVVVSSTMLVSGAYAASAEGTEPDVAGDVSTMRNLDTGYGAASDGRGGAGTVGDAPEDEASGALQTAAEGADSSESEPSGTKATTEGQSESAESLESADSETSRLQSDVADTADDTQPDSSDGSRDGDITTQAIEGHTVPGVSPRGTTIDLFDYDIPAINQDHINQDHVFQFFGNCGAAYNAPLTKENVNCWTGAQKPAPRQGIVTGELDSGYPKLTDVLGGESLSYLFGNESIAGKSAHMGVDGLLQVDDEGYYYYSSAKNFAEYNADDNTFTLYDKPGVVPIGTSPNGQFFPFNKGHEVFNVDPNGELAQKTDVNSGNNGPLNHYFGLSMSTRFVQQNGGRTAPANEGRQDVTYNFSGDDDVWVYIDGILIGDVGGVHDQASLQINFRTGEVVVYSDGRNLSNKESGDNVYTETNAIDGNTATVAEISEALNNRRDVYWKKTTLKQLFENAGVDVSGWASDTLPDNTYHTLDFFYLERGGSDSNMSLKYNLVSIPESGIVKVDQTGTALSGVEFDLYPANERYEVDENAQNNAVHGVTDEHGELVFLHESTVEGQTSTPITLDELGDTSRYWVLRETSPLPGYRNPGDIKLRFAYENADDSSKGHGPLLSSNHWDTGAYAEPHATVRADSQVKAINDDSVIDLDAGGTMFAVVMKHVDTDVDGVFDEWRPVSGDASRGWNVASDASEQSILKAALASNYVFEPGTNGAWETTIENLPGDITKYRYMMSTNGNDPNAEKNAEYSIAYFYTEAENLADATAANTTRVQADADDGGYTGFDRVFSVTLNVPNILNRVIVQKVDENDQPVNGITFNLYKESDVDVKSDGRYVIHQGAVPVQSGTTTTLELEPDQVSVKGGVIFTGLEDGTYYAVEVSNDGPDYVQSNGLWYAVNKHAAKIVVRDSASGGVYADAGTSTDDISVMRSIGRLVDTMKRFAVNDQVDSTLHDVVATPQLWEGSQWHDVEGADALHLKFDDASNDQVLDYMPESDTGQMFYTVETGMPRLRVNQCQTHKTDPRQELRDTDLTNLFTGMTVVRVRDRQYGSLKISKTVTTDEGATLPESERDRKFKFTITLTPAKGSATALQIADKYPARIYNGEDKTGADDTGEDSVTEGSITFGQAGDGGTRSATVLLGNDEYVVIEGIPVGTAYMVEETPVDGYETTMNPMSGKGVVAVDTKPEKPGELDPTTATDWIPGSEVVVTNTYTVLAVSSLPLTGDGTTARNLLAAGGLTLMLAGAAWLLARRRRV